MNEQEFTETIVSNRLYLTEKILGAKGKEYARGDRLSNFKKAAILMGCTPERALFGFVSKHIVALSDFVGDLEKGHVQALEQWDEKLGDIIVYMILLEALVIERHQNFKK